MISKISEVTETLQQNADFVVVINEKMVPLIPNVPVEITLWNILPIVSLIMNIPQENLVGAEQSMKLVSRMLDIIEIIPEKIPLEKQQVAVSYSNLAIGAAKVEKDTFNGLVFAVSYGTNETEARSEIYNGSIPQAEDKMDYISLPKRLFKHLKDEEQSVFSRISIFCLRNDKLYRLIQNSSSQAITKIGSRIIAANIPNVKIADLDEPVKISFNVTGQTATNPQCVYWDDSPGQNPHWSSKGCNTSNDVSGENVVCSCNHLTSFALLMDAHQKGKKTNSRLLSIISNVGCGISFVCLILTVIIHAYFKNLWKLIASKILVNLCISLAVTYLIFLVGFQEYSTKLTAVCKAMAALLHYSLLSSFMWMSVEALHIYLGLFVFKTIRSSFIKRSSILVWGIPAVIVTITLAINNTNNYNRVEHVCWLSNAAFYAALLAPVVIILFFNLVIFVCVMWRVNSMRNDKQAEHKTKKVRVFGILGLCVLLGFPWILAFFAFGEAAEAFQFLFAIFNTLQGMFIFMCYCIYKKDTRDVVCLFVCKRKTGDPMEARQFFKSSISNHETECKKAETNA
ncbi:adhesion G-protein coupled receptor G6 isoform X1 [Octopus bimaculoides]|nr:adhesion G-protein coupled receptor G6 isoform X1 [Octopus bimaculoides]